MFRDGVAEFFNIISKNNIKCYIVSGGIKSVMIQCLEMLSLQENLPKIRENTHICATEEIIDENNLLVGFKEPFVTSINKPSALTYEKYNDIKINSNAIIVGDYLLDTHSGDNLPLKTTLTIGFYNGCGDGTLKEYLLAYDMVILGDGSYSHITNIINKIIKGDDTCDYKEATFSSEHYQFFTKL